MKKPNKFTYPVKLIPLNVENKPREEIVEYLNQIPYLLYEVEILSDGRKIVINKPGGKRNFGRLSKNDFMVFILDPDTEELWLISHDEIFADIEAKLKDNCQVGLRIIDALLDVCNGEEPDNVLEKYQFNSTLTGLPVELLLKTYKWIWGQEDVNYPKGEGRWKSMNHIIELGKKYSTEIDN
jgi:hypothetical protein